MLGVGSSGVGMSCSIGSLEDSHWLLGGRDIDGFLLSNHTWVGTGSFLNSNDTGLDTTCMFMSLRSCKGM